MVQQNDPKQHLCPLIISASDCHMSLHPPSHTHTKMMMWRKACECREDIVKSMDSSLFYGKDCQHGSDLCMHFQGLPKQVTSNQVSEKLQEFICSQSWRPEIWDQQVSEANSFWRFWGENLFHAAASTSFTWPQRPPVSSNRSSWITSCLSSSILITLSAHHPLYLSGFSRETEKIGYVDIRIREDLL